MARQIFYSSLQIGIYAQNKSMARQIFNLSMFQVPNIENIHETGWQKKTNGSVNL